MIVEIPCLGDGRTTIEQTKDQKQRTKRKQLNDNVQVGAGRTGRAAKMLLIELEIF